MRLLILLIAFAMPIAHASDVAIGIEFGYPVGIYKNTKTDAWERTFENSFMGLRTRFFLCDWIAIGVHLDYLKLTTIKSGYRFRHLTVAPSLELIYPLEIEGDIISYQRAHAGVSVGIDDAHLENRDYDEKRGIAFTIFSGVEFAMSRHFALRLNASFLYREYRYDSRKLELENGFLISMEPVVYL